MYEEYYEKIEQECLIRNLRPSTADVYFNQITVFLRWIGDKNPDDLTLSDVRNYISFLRLEKHLSTSYCNGINSALRFFYKFILRKKWDPDEVPRMVLDRELPKVLTLETIEKLIDTATETRNKAIIALLYFSGLRVGELCRLAPEDIYMSTMQVHVRHGKNHCDRWTILSKTALDLLIQYWHEYPMKRDYLFVSLKSPYSQLNTSGVEIMLRKVSKAAGLETVNPHMLRHSFASHMVEHDVSKARKDNRGRALKKGESQRSLDGRYKRVQRLMHKAGLVGKRPKEKYHSYKGEVGKIADNIIDRDFSTTAPLQKWTTDVSQFNFSWGKCYISPILDMNTNEIISYDLALHPTLDQIQRMLDRAFKKFPSVEGIVFHSDQGWQYQHAYYRKVLKERGIIQSMSRKGNCYDNCIMETFFGRLKNEMYYGYEKDYSSFEEFAKAVEEYIDYYNNKRIQAKTKWMPPVKYRIASMCSA